MITAYIPQSHTTTLEFWGFRFRIVGAPALIAEVGREFYPAQLSPFYATQPADFEIALFNRTSTSAFEHYNSSTNPPHCWNFLLSDTLFARINPKEKQAEIHLFTGCHAVEMRLCVYGIINMVIKLALSQTLPVASFHAAAFGGRHGIVLLPAGSGGGKSTLSALINQRGYIYYGDEDAIVIENRGAFYLYPLYRQLRLDASILQIIPPLQTATYNTPITCFDQQLIEFLTDSGPPDTLVPLDHIIFLHPSGPDSFAIRATTHKERLRLLFTAFEPIPRSLFGGRGATQFKWYNRLAFELILKLADSIPIHQLHYSLPNHYDRVLAHLEAEVPR